MHHERFEAALVGEPERLQRAYTKIWYLLVAMKKYHRKTKWTQRFKVSCQPVCMLFPSIAPTFLPLSTVSNQINQNCHRAVSLSNIHFHFLSWHDRINSCRHMLRAHKAAISAGAPNRKHLLCCLLPFWQNMYAACTAPLSQDLSRSFVQK